MATFAASVRNHFFRRLDPFENVRIRRGLEDGSIRLARDVIPLFEESSVFAFATGGSLDNLQDMDSLRTRNVAMLTTGPIHFFHRYGFMPNIWLIHNPDSVAMSIRAIDELDLRGKIDFSGTFIFVPGNNSHSKIHFSSARFRRFREVIGEATYVLYEERMYDRKDSAADLVSGSAVPESYMQKAKEPVATMNGSSLEAFFLPFLVYLGVSHIYFSGVDHMDTGHFWDRNDPWQNEDGTPKSFGDQEIVLAAGRVARARIAELGVEVCRLEPVETILTEYPLVSLESAVERSSSRVEPKQDRNGAPA